MGWHLEKREAFDYRQAKEERVRTGNAHAALVVDDQGLAHGWAQWGDPDELPGIKHRRAYDRPRDGDAPPRPDWRIGCVFVDKRHRGQGIARLAVEGALEQIAAAGGGLVEAISEVTDGREAQGRFLFSATVELFEDFGFERGRQLGKHAYLATRVVEPQ
ncbi:MAG: GNAT family N-acetyltransferase [Actinomycetales bacterium]